MDERPVFLPLAVGQYSAATLCKGHWRSFVWGETGGALDRVASASEDWGRIIADAEEGYHRMRGGFGGKAHEIFRNADQLVGE